MVKEDLNEYFKDKYPHLFGLYKFLFERRVKDIDDKINYLTLLTSISLAFTFGLQGIITSKLFWAPIFFLAISMFMLLYSTIPHKFWFHWFEKEHYKEFYLDSKNFYEMGFRDIFGTIPHLNEYSDSRKRIYLFSIFLLFFSFVSTIGILTYSFSQRKLLGFLVFSILSILVLILSLKINKELIDNPSKETEDFFDKLVSIEKDKKGKI